MVIGLYLRRGKPVVMLLAFLLGALGLALRVVADDQIVKKSGEVITGNILSVSNGQVMIESVTPSGGKAKFPAFLPDIKSVTMATPPEVTKALSPSATPAQVIAALEGPVKTFAGLPVQWVVDAMAELGDAYSQVGQADKALAIYNQIATLYPGSPYTAVADASKAQVSLEANKIDDALKLVSPIVEKANKDIAPSPIDGAAYAKAFLVYGRILEAQQKPAKALEAYLTVKTMFYQSAATAAEAERYAKTLSDKMRVKDPGFGVE